MRGVYKSNITISEGELESAIDHELSMLFQRSLKTEEYVNADAAAEYLKIPVGSLRNMTSNGQIPFYKLGRRNRYRIEDLRNLLLSQRRGVSHGN